MMSQTPDRHGESTQVRFSLLPEGIVLKANG